MSKISDEYRWAGFKRIKGFFWTLWVGKIVLSRAGHREYVAWNFHSPIHCLEVNIGTVRRLPNLEFRMGNMKLEWRRIPRWVSEVEGAKA